MRSLIELDPIVQTWFKVCYVLDDQEMYIFTELLCGKSAKEIATTCPRKKFKNGEFTRLAKGKRSKTGIGVDYSRVIIAVRNLKNKISKYVNNECLFIEFPDNESYKLKKERVKIIFQIEKLKEKLSDINQKLFNLER
jgi:hypothetical protein